MTKIRVILLLTTIGVVGILGYFVSFMARGYRFDSKKIKFSSSGILVAKSEPDGASIYINGNLKGATNSNITLTPGTYDLEIKQLGYISWKKRLAIEKEEVTQVTAHLFKNAPSLTPITYDGAKNPVISPDYNKIAYINNEGLWVMQAVILPIGFRNEPKMITDGDLEGSSYTFSPDDREILLETQSGLYLLDISNFTKQSQRINVSAKRTEILKSWEKDSEAKKESLFKLLPEKMQQILKDKTEKFVFSPDNNMVLYTTNGDDTIPDNLIKPLPGSSTQAQNRDIKKYQTYIYDIKEDRNFYLGTKEDVYYWLPTSRHLINPLADKIVIMDYDGTNRQGVFSGSYISPHAYPFVNASQLLILTSFGSEETIPNLYSLSIK